MKISILNLQNNYCDIGCGSISLSEAARVLSLNGFFVENIFTSFNEKDLSSVLPSLLKAKPNILIVIGNTALFAKHTKKDIPDFVEDTLFEIGNMQHILCDNLTNNFLHEVIVPTIKQKEKKAITVEVYRTFGIEYDTLTELLAPCIANKAKIKFEFFRIGHLDYETHIKYAQTAPVGVVEEIRRKTAVALKPHLYALKSIDLNELVVEILQTRKKTVCVAESFTGGALAAKLVEVEGASAVIKEGLVVYSNDSKTSRLKIDTKLLKNYGAVSIETVYEMAALELSQAGADYVLATTGYASAPVSTDQTKNAIRGNFFIAVGDSKDIHIHQHVYAVGTKRQVMNYGVSQALFALYKKLTK